MKSLQFHLTNKLSGYSILFVFNYKYRLLTPGDFRLCAFLRMNLASKEIAPLLGIPVRGVENHRYKLRKKLNLEADGNLTDFIIRL